MAQGIIITGLSLLVCMELVSSIIANNCTSFQAFGKIIGDQINSFNLDLKSDLGKNYSCVSVTCNKLKCAGIPVYISSTLKQNVTFTADIDYCSPKPRIQVYASFFNVTVNATLLNGKTVPFNLSAEYKKTYISTKFVQTNEEINVRVIATFIVPDGAKVEAHLSGTISSSDCPGNTTKRSLAVKTTPNITIMTKPQTSTPKPTKPTNSTPKTNKPKTSTNKQTKTTILVVSIIIAVIVIIVMVIYYRKKKRSGNLPAYYNDIVLNDPLYSEIENNAESTNDADGNNDYDEEGDEVHLFQ